MNAKLACMIVFLAIGQPLLGQELLGVRKTNGGNAVIAHISDDFTSSSPFSRTSIGVSSAPIVSAPTTMSTAGNLPADDCGCDAIDTQCVTCETPCCTPGPCLSVYGGFIYWRPRDADVSFAAPIDGPIVGNDDANPIFVGPIAVTDPDYNPGFFAGFQWGIDCGTFLDVRFTMLESDTRAATQTTPPDVIRSLVAHPSTASAATDFLRAEAQLSIDLDYVDASYRHLFHGGPRHAVHYFVGGRYAHLDQRFDSLFSDNGTEAVRTDLDFDGGGLMLGLDAVRFSCHHGLNVYGNTSASFVAGRFRGSYLQGSSIDPVVVDTQWEAGRIVPILDIELGVGWTSKNGHVSLGAGYLVGAWFNTPNTEDFIHSVQSADFSGTDGTLSFDGLVAHAELKW